MKAFGFGCLADDTTDKMNLSLVALPKRWAIF